VTITVPAPMPDKSAGSSRMVWLVRATTVALLTVIAVQGARLFWATLTPAGPVGAGPVGAASGQASGEGDASFDPFFRLQVSAASSTVTSLPLKLTGTRLNDATGQGSAIIATPDGVQSSYGVGESIMPGVKLWSVAQDEVTIDRGGARERLFLDQSVAVAPVTLPVNPVIVPAVLPPLPEPPSSPPEPR
jgi:general secretion pathway protein C